MNLENDTFLRACRREPVERTPVWIMRQAGRYLPEYRELKERYDFLTLSRTADLLAQVTLQPLKRFPLDAAIVFADIMTPLHSIGLEIDFSPGPVVSNPVRSAADVAALLTPDPQEIALFLAEGLAAIAQELPSHQALIGFAGAPFTLLCYVVEGGGSKDFMTARSFLYGEPEAAEALLERLTQVQIDDLRMQHASGGRRTHAIRFVGRLALGGCLPALRGAVRAAYRRVAG